MRRDAELVVDGHGDLAEGEPPSRYIKPEEITRVPDFLEDLPEIRRELANLITDPKHQPEIESMRRKLPHVMQRTGYPFAEAFAHRDNKELVSTVLEEVKQEYRGKYPSED